jgi:NTE family protein
MVAGRLPRKDWPERRMMIVAVNAETGELTPDADSRDAMGTNQIDFATRIPSASAGYAQGKLEAPRLTSLAE